MDRGKILFYWTLVTGIIITLIGILHNAFAPTMYKVVSTKFPPEASIRYIYMFVAMGTAVIYAGLLIIYSSFSLKKFKLWAWNISFISLLFIAIIDIGALFSQFSNLLIYIIVLSSVINALLLLLFRKNFMI